MKRYSMIDLTLHNNHKLVYTKVPEETGKEEFGMDNICILKSDLKMNKEEMFSNVNFKFNFGKYDNVVCNRQSILIGEFATKVHIIGFAYWGDTNEYIKIVYEDGSEEFQKLTFVDWSHEATNNFSGRYWHGNNVNTVKIVISSGAMAHLIHFHHITCKCTKNQAIKEVVLPDNMFIHIFAMTLENENHTQE